MKTIQPFIDLGWHTVPLKGTIKRLESGKKTIPEFEKGWKERYQKRYNEKPAELGGAITGAISGIIAVDADNAETTAIIDALAPSHPFTFRSEGKQGCTYIFEYDPELCTTFSLHDGRLSLDFYSDNGFIYLPTDANQSKQHWSVETIEDLPEIPTVPSTLKAMLAQFMTVEKKSAHEPEYRPRPQVANYLAPQLTMLVGKKSFLPGLFRIITPRDFRDLAEYVQFGYLHPANIPDGRGSEYLSKVSAILGKDSSVDEELYKDAMHTINDFWEDPMPKTRLYSTVIEPMLNGNSAIDGESIWQYDPYWSDRNLVVNTKRGDSLEVFFDDNRMVYYVVDLLNERLMPFGRDNDLATFLETVGTNPMSRKELKANLPLVTVNKTPAKTFGFYKENEYERSFNSFVQTPALHVLSEPDTYAPKYQYPETIINYLRSLCPDNQARHYLLRFLKRKLLRFEYSPVILYFLGKPGSGKDTFVKLLEKIVGIDSIARPTTKEFLEIYNSWLLDTYFVQLDEYGNQLTRMSDKEEVLGKIKAYTGKPEVQIRSMRTDSINAIHTATFIMTANKNPLLLEEDDRRVFLIETPNALSQQDWVISSGGLGRVFEQLESELLDFCYYLATEIEELSVDEYVTPPSSYSKHVIIGKSMSAAPQLAYYFKQGLMAELEDLVTSYNCESIIEGWVEGRVYEDELFQLYLQMTDHHGNKRAMSRALTEAGFNKIPTTKNGGKSYYFQVPQIAGFTLNTIAPLAHIEVKL